MNTLSLRPSHKVIGPQTENFDVLVELSAPENPSLTRPSLNVVFALDISGSMMGSPIDNAKRAIISFAEHLRPTDRVGVVVYSSSARVLVPAQPATDHAKKSLIAAVSSMQAEGSTALHQGWLLAAQQAAPFVNDYGLSRIILLSDGEANLGQSNPAVFREEASQLAAAGVGTTTCGLGQHFNEAIMTSLAQGGRAFYAESSHQINDYFQTELNLMSLVVGKNLSFSCHLLDPSTDQSIELSPLNQTAALGHGRHASQDLIAGARSWLLFHADLSSRVKKSLKLVVVAQYLDLSGQKCIAEKIMDIPFESNEVLTDDLDVVERRKELTAALLQERASQAARLGRWGDVDQCISGLHAIAGNNAYVQGVAHELSNLSARRDSNLFSKEAAFASYSMSTRNVALHEDVSRSEDHLGLKKTKQSSSKLSPVENQGDAP